MDLTSRDSLEPVYGALRVQAAAVAAQQAALTEDETRLQQRRAALERQEEQLATRLEEQRSQLLALQENARAEQATLRKERSDFERYVATLMFELEQGRREVQAAQEQMQVHRQRLVALRRRLKERNGRQLAAEKAALAEQKRGLETEAGRLGREKAALEQALLRHNTDRELGRRQIQHGWDELAEAVRQWQEQKAQGQATSQHLDARAAALSEAECALARQQQEWAAKRRDLEKELEGLENRVRNQRTKVNETQPTAPSTGPLSTITTSRPRLLPCSPTDSRGPNGGLSQVADLERLSSELSDHRLCLVEQLAQMLLVWQRWQTEREAATAELTPLAHRLREREQAVEAREQALKPLEHDLWRRRDELARARLGLEGRQARLSAQEANWRCGHDAFLDRLRAREQQLEHQRAAFANLRQRWGERRRQEVAQLRAERSWCEGLRRECALLREEWLRRSEALEQGRRVLTEQALALEQYRSECVAGAEDSVSAEKRINSLRRSWASLHAAAERTIARERRALVAETVRLEERSRRLELQAAELMRREAELADRQLTWEHERAETEAASAELRREVQTMRAVAALHEQQLDKLRDEVERMARLLIGDEGTVPASRAA